MKKISVILMVLVLVFTLCSCGLAPSKIKSNLKGAGYTVLQFSEDEISQYNDMLIYQLGGSGSIVDMFRGENPKNIEDTVMVIEFSNKDDLTLWYKKTRTLIKEEGKEGYKLDLSGNILVYGPASGVEAALD